MEHNWDPLGGWPLSHNLALFDVGIELLAIMRDRQRKVLDHLQCIIYLLRLGIDVRALNDTNKRLLEAQRDLEDALEQFQRVIRLLEDFQAHV